MAGSRRGGVESADSGDGACTQCWWFFFVGVHELCSPSRTSVGSIVKLAVRFLGDDVTLLRQKKYYKRLETWLKK